MPLALKLNCTVSHYFMFSGLQAHNLSLFINFFSINILLASLALLYTVKIFKIIYVGTYSRRQFLNTWCNTSCKKKLLQNLYDTHSAENVQTRDEYRCTHCMCSSDLNASLIISAALLLLFAEKQTILPPYWCVFYKLACCASIFILASDHFVLRNLEMWLNYYMFSLLCW